MTYIFAIIQFPLALALIRHCCKVRRRLSGWIRDTLTLVAAAGGGLIAWRLATLIYVNDPAERAVGGMSVMTIAFFLLFLLVRAIGQLSAEKR